MKNILDIHTHTLASVHAYSTLRDNIAQAKARGLKILGTADHAKAMKGVQTNGFFINYGIIPRVVDDIIVLCGVEANIRDQYGRIDIDLNNIKVDYAIISLHTPCISPSTPANNTKAVLRALNQPKVKIVGHPDDSGFPLIYEELVDGIVAKGAWAEVNNTSLTGMSYRKNSRENLIKMLTLGKEKGMKIVLNSDAHFDMAVGDLSASEELIKELDYPRELVLNYKSTPEEVLDALDIKMEK